MINHNRAKQTRRSILEALAMAGNYALPEATLWSYVDDVVRPKVNLAERGTSLHFLKEGGYIRRIEDSLDPEMKQWVITELGRNLLASL